MFKCTVNYLDGKVRACKVDMEKIENVIKYSIAEQLDYSEISSIDYWLNDVKIKAGDEGYYLVPCGCAACVFRESAVGYFKEREDIECENPDSLMPVFGLCHQSGTFLAIVTGMPYDSFQLINIKNNTYSFGYRIKTNGRVPHEEPTIEQHILSNDTTYSDMGVYYRNYLFKKGFKPIKERLNPELEYATESIAVRVRMGWKPVPCEVLEQTPETEPPMHVACTFSDVEKIMHSYKKAGVEKAEFCLVGWNVSGHDGRWPQIFPVEERLGGEKGLKKLIATANELGYAVVCHTNSTDAYSIAENFSKDDLIIRENGDVDINCERWSGGRMYNVCPKRGYEMALEDLPKVAELGFRGLHYIDVVSIVSPRECHSKLHPLNKREGLEYFDKLFELSKELFGGMSSEGAFEYNMKHCDFALYVSFMRDETSQNDLVDEYVPFWQIVFHGTVLSNPYPSGINAIKSPNKKDLLKTIEYGGRPTIYYYARFATDRTDWIGDGDFRMHTDEFVEDATQNTKELYDICKETAYLQYEFMEKHEKLADNVYKVTYSDGSEITVDYNNMTYKLEK